MNNSVVLYWLVAISGLVYGYLAGAFILKLRIQKTLEAIEASCFSFVEYYVTIASLALKKVDELETKLKQYEKKDESDVI